MKWFIMLLIFIGGIYYLVNKRNADIRAEESRKAMAEQIKKEQIKASPEPELPVKTEKVYVLKFSQQTLTTLRSMTTDPNEKVRFAAVELLWQLQDEQAPILIKKMFQEETDAEVKKMLIGMLGRDKSKLSLALLAEALNDYDKQTRLLALEAASTFQSKDAIAVLTRAMQDYDEEVRLKAIQSINQVRHDIELNKEQQLLQETEKKEPRFQVE